MFEVKMGLDIETSTKLNLYAALSHQTAEQAAQSILREFLATTGEVRIEHQISKLLDQCEESGGCPKYILTYSTNVP